MNSPNKSLSGLGNAAECGVIAVEFAIMLPFLLILLLTIVDLGLVIRDHQILENAAREGARYSALEKNWVDPRNPTASEQAIKDRVIEYCADHGITVNSADIVLDQNYPMSVGGQNMTTSRMRITYQHSMLTPGGSALTSGPVDLVAEAFFRNFY